MLLTIKYILLQSFNYNLVFILNPSFLCSRQEVHALLPSTVIGNLVLMLNVSLLLYNVKHYGSKVIIIVSFVDYVQKL